MKLLWYFESESLSVWIRDHIQENLFITRFIIADIKYTTTSTGVGYGSGFELTKDTPYLALTGELWDVFCEYFDEKRSCYKGVLLYLFNYNALLWLLSSGSPRTVVISLYVCWELFLFSTIPFGTTLTDYFTDTRTITPLSYRHKSKLGGIPKWVTRIPNRLKI